MHLFSNYKIHSSIYLIKSKFNVFLMSVILQIKHKSRQEQEDCALKILCRTIKKKEFLLHFFFFKKKFIVITEIIL